MLETYKIHKNSHPKQEIQIKRRHNKTNVTGCLCVCVCEYKTEIKYDI